jgi:hypothetical protein
MNWALASAAGLAAAAAAYGLNCLVLRRLGTEGLWLAVPAVEETLKTGIPALLGLPLLGAHIAFGLVEAGYELAGPYPSRTAAGLALATHASFGLLTAALASKAGGIGPAVLAAVALHSTFNLAVVRRSGAGGRPREAAR